MGQIRHFDVQSVELDVPFETAFDYIADPRNLPEWTHAFAHVNGARALMRTPAGEVELELKVTADRDAGTIDWTMTFGEGQVAKAFSRAVRSDAGGVIYSFILQAPPVPTERLEGTLAEQSKVLATELATLTRLLQNRGRVSERVTVQ